MFVVVNKIAQFSSTIALDDIKKIDTLQNEIKKVIEYWNTHAEGKDIKKVCLIGSLAHSEGLVEKLEPGLNISVILGDVWAGLANKDRVPPIEFTEALNYGVAIGLAINE
jgi:Tfp pilus assembly PilM family ATPase